MRNGDLLDSQHGMAVGARRASLSISETVHLKGFPCTIISCIYREYLKKEKEKINENALFEVTCQRKMARLPQAYRKETLT